MASGVLRVLDIEREELLKVSVLILQSVFLGVFAGAFDIGAQSLFLKEYDASMIPKAFAVSGAVGIVITAIYSWLQPRMKFSDFALANLLFVGLISLVLRLSYELLHDTRIIFAMLVMMGPLTIIAFLGFWGTVGRMFTLRQGKRLFGLIDTGQIIGMILSFYSIPLFISFGFEVVNSLYLCAASIVLAIAVQFYINRKFPVRQEDSPGTATKAVTSRFADLFKNNYTLLMVGFVVLSVLAAFFIHYSFLSITQVNYPESNALAQFLGVFMGTLMVFTLGIKALVYSKLMKTYGLKVALMLSPVILGIFTLIALFIGTVYGYTAASAGFTLFFLLIVSSKLFAKSLKDSIEVPSSKILYQTLDKDVRYDVQARIDGIVNELAAFSSGLLMAGLVLMQKITIIHFSWVMLVIVILWAWTALRLYKAYRASLKKSLDRFKLTREEQTDARGSRHIDLHDPKESARLALYLDLAPQAWDGFLSSNLEALINHPSIAIKDRALALAGKLHLLDAEKILRDNIPLKDLKTNDPIAKTFARFLAPEKMTTDNGLSLLIRSSDPEQRFKALAYLHKHPDRIVPSQLLPLLRDSHHEVRTAAIRFIGMHRIVELSPALIDLLDSTEFYPLAYHALASMSSSITDKLDQAWYRSGVSPKERMRLLRLIVLSDSHNVLKPLLSKLDEEDTDILKLVLNELNRRKYTPDELIKSRLVELLHRMVGLAAWNMTAKYSAETALPQSGLDEAFTAEIKDNFDIIYTILSILYDENSIRQIRTNLESGTSEGIGFAMELLDIFVDETIKPYLFPLLDDTSIVEKVSGLQTEFPVEILKSEELLLAIINRDYNQLKLSTRLIALQNLDKRAEFSSGDDIIAQLFNPRALLHETAAEIVSKNDPNLLQSVLPRLPGDIRRNISAHLDRISQGVPSGVLHKYEALKQSEILAGTAPDIVIALAEGFSFCHEPGFKTSNVFETEPAEDAIIFTLNELTARMPSSSRLAGNCFYRLSALSSPHAPGIELPSEADNSILKISSSGFSELLFDREEAFLPVLLELKTMDAEKAMN
jgi:ATP/ADP translocase